MQGLRVPWGSQRSYFWCPATVDQAEGGGIGGFEIVIRVRFLGLGLG